MIIQYKMVEAVEVHTTCDFCGHEMVLEFPSLGLSLDDIQLFVWGHVATCQQCSQIDTPGFLRTDTLIGEWPHAAHE